MADNPRAGRLADRIKLIVAETLERGIRDPRIGFVTITEVRLTGDSQHATIFYTVLGTDAEREDTQKALDRAKGHIRTEIGKNIRARLTPSIEFVPDALPESAHHIESLLTAARERDRESQNLAKDAKYAGEEDPYVKPRESDETDGE